MKRVFGHAAIVIFLILHVGLLSFACIHWRNGWSLFIFLPLIVAFLAPTLCQNYATMPMELLSSGMEYQNFQSCREFGWIFAFFIGICAYIPPVLAWYNTPFPMAGVIMVFVSVLCVHWTYLTWLRMYVLL